MTEELKMVESFHEKFDLFIGKSPKIPKKDIASLRARLCTEECIELQEELLSLEPDLSKIAKEITDNLYVIYGCIISYGLQDKIQECFEETHRSNMSKLHNGEVVKNEFGKVIKGPDYSPADINKILNGNSTENI